MMSNNTLLDTILGAIVEQLEADLSRCGFMYHIFWRTKSELNRHKEMHYVLSLQLQNIFLACTKTKAAIIGNDILPNFAA